MDYTEIMRHQSARLDAYSKHYMIDSFCRANNLDKNEMLGRGRKPSPSPPRRGPGRPPAKPPTTDELQIDHDIRMAKKRLELDRANAERESLRREKDKTKVHSVTDGGDLVMKDGTIKPSQEAAKAPEVVQKVPDLPSKKSEPHPQPDDVASSQEP